MEKRFITKEQEALDLINGRMARGKFSRIYPFCNENVAGYFDFFDFNEKSLLTVGSSADQSINAIYKGCKDITILDICPFTEEYFYLKSAAIQSLEPADFDKLLFHKDYPHTFRHNRHPFEIKELPNLLEKLKTLSPKSHDFWLSLTSTKSGEMIRKNLFSSDEEKPAVTKQLNIYLQDEKAYYDTRRKLSEANPTFITADITKTLPDRTFDNIILSNLTTYYNQDEIAELFKSLIEHLNPGGMLMLGYLFRTDEYPTYHKEWDDIYDTDAIKTIHPEIKLQSFQGVKGVLFKNKQMKDSIYVYQKKK